MNSPEIGNFQPNVVWGDFNFKPREHAYHRPTASTTLQTYKLTDYGICGDYIFELNHQILPTKQMHRPQQMPTMPPVEIRPPVSQKYQDQMR
ncbi:hypothetical protein SARC_07240 [Sphaeroforma arctica JP610]|uniref:Uncharacterized protein n=1 Tax=Sphaeroforma arctica JP610 TaxID=667725 RepID=A0A0L0FU93_9EUKA|nr:hypothetical protein SARC_07240 [Sphaeroforma arctica JP610]KNC80397.1 hypothetical protein SARC_07240 [Sphaeroforma arctica JP610]|eukprot:XP_014154299.1 hypothetical protein SARC_07240 [Sphaeroforma arctica JP610]